MKIDYLKEKQLAFIVTSHCNLNCKYCAQLTPYLKKKNLTKHIPLEKLEKEYKAVFQIYDYFEDVTISGGEPLTHPNITDIVSYNMKFESQFDHLRIFSNGTIMPSKKLMEQFKRYDKLILVVDDYGPKISTKIADIRELFKNENLPLRVNIYHTGGGIMHANGWIDYGDPKKFRNYSDEELETMYKNCHVAQYKSIIVYDGKILNCGWTLFGDLADVFPKDNPPPEKYAENQVLNILDESIPLERKREIAASWGTKPNWQCQYCNGFDVKKAKRIPGGEQI